MSPGRFSCVLRCRLLALALLLVAGASLAGDYAQVDRLVRAGRAAEALAQADQYLATRPRDPQMRFLRGLALAESGRTNEAIAAYTTLTEEFPELPEPYNNLAVLHASQDRLDQARAALEAALRANPGYAVAQENLGDIHLRLALRAWNRARELDPQLATVAPKLAAARSVLAVPGTGAATAPRP